MGERTLQWDNVRKVKSDSLGTKGTGNLLTQQYSQVARLPNNLGKTSCWSVAGCLISEPWLSHACHEQEPPWGDLCALTPPDCGKRRRDGSSSPFSPWPHPHQADAITGFRSAGGGPPEEWGRLCDASKLTRENMRMFSRACTVTREWMSLTHTLVFVWDTCIQHAQKSSNAGKGGAFFTFVLLENT